MQKKCSGQYSVLIQIPIVTGNEKLCRIYFKKLFFQNVLAFINLFYWYHYIRYFIYSVCMGRRCVQYVQKQSTEVFFKKGVLKTFANLTGKPLSWSLFLNKVAGLRTYNFIKTRPQHWYFPAKLAKFYEHFFWRTSVDDCWSNDM